MDLQLADKVNYKGGQVCFGFVGETDQYDIHNIPPTNGTYIWQIIHHPSDGNFYVIQHVQGKPKEFYQQQERFFGEIDFTKLKEGNKYIVVPAQDLVSLENRKHPIPMVEPKFEENSSKKCGLHSPEEGFVLEENEPIEKIVIKKEVVEPIENFDIQNEIDEINNEIELDFPYLTPETCPLNIMVQVAPKSMLMFARKMAEPFMIQTPSGDKAKGRGGDYVIRTQNDYLYIHPKETFDSMFEDRIEMPTKKIGEEQKIYRIEKDVFDYINFLEEENERFRNKLYLKND